MHFLWPMSVECMVSCGTGQPQYSQIMAIHMYCWPEPYIYGAYTVFLAGKSPNIRSYTVCMYGSGQPYTYGYGQYPRSIHSYGYGQYPRSIHSWLWPIPKVNTFMAMANTQGQYIHMVMAITQGQYIHMAMANIWPLHSYGYGQYLRPIKYGYGQYMAITWSNQNGVQFLLTLIPARPFSHTRLLMPELCIAKRATHNHHHIFALKWTLNNSVQPGVHLFCPPLSSFYPSLRLC